MSRGSDNFGAMCGVEHAVSVMEARVRRIVFMGDGYWSLTVSLCDERGRCAEKRAGHCAGGWMVNSRGGGRWRWGKGVQKGREGQ